MRILVTGASGLFGSKMVETAETKGHEVYSGYWKDHPSYGTPIGFDVSDMNRVREAFERAKPEVVVHSAALTDVDRCETNKERAWQVNVEGTRNIVESAKSSHAFLVYVSTDYVFNGETGRYLETDKPDPINHYGLTKMKGEELVKNLMDKCCIARASVTYGSTPAAGKTNFALWVLDKLKSNEQIRIVTDQWNSPTLNTNLADMTLEIIERKLTGTFHLSGATRICRYDFAKLIAQTFNLDTNLVTPITSAELSWAAKRPRDSSLNTGKAKQTLRNKPFRITQALERMKHELT